MARLSGTQRTIVLIGVTAVVALGAGIGLSQFIISPSEAAAEAAAPEAGPITVPVEFRALANDVVIRGDATYEGSTEVELEAGDFSGAAIVTGKVPEVGSTLAAGDVLLEVTGRPVIVLEGDLPVYRSLRAGSEGPDVVQLKKALKKLGHFSGGTKNDVFGSSTAAAVEALYASIGYEAPAASDEAEQSLRGARDMVRAARDQVTSLEQELASAGGPSKTELKSAEFELSEAQIELRRAKKNGTKAEIRAAQHRVDMARLALEELKKPADTSAIRSALTAARESLREAQRELADAQRGVLTPMPASEIVFLSSTPRRVDDVYVQRGHRVEGAVMMVSGADLQIKGSTSAVDAALLSVGQEVLIDLPGGEPATGEILAIGEADGQGAGSRVPVTIIPVDLTDEQVGALQGANVRVRIPVSSTGGEVLAVPIAALTAGPGGEDRIEVWDPVSKTSTLVQVTTGLAAGGFVEVEAIGAELAEGDLVVVGIEAARAKAAEAEEDEDGSAEEPADEPEDSETAETSEEATEEAEG